MKKYIGTKEVLVHIIRLQHRIMSRYINVLECCIGKLGGSPKAPLHCMTFSDALEILKEGGSVKRHIWNGFIYYDSGVILYKRFDNNTVLRGITLADIFANDWEIVE